MSFQREYSFLGPLTIYKRSVENKNVSKKIQKSGSKQINAVNMHVIVVVDQILGLCKSYWVDFTKTVLKARVGARKFVLKIFSNQPQFWQKFSPFVSSCNVYI